MFDKLIINLFFRILRKDKEYRASWHDNIAMTIYDAGGDYNLDKHINANMWAGNLMRILTHIDTFAEWKERVRLNDKILCHYCPHTDQCKSTELPGSGHCFAVLQHRNPLEKL